MKKKIEVVETVQTQEVSVNGAKIDKLSVTFQSEDLNKVVEKINELIEKK